MALWILVSLALASSAAAAQMPTGALDASPAQAGGQSRIAAPTPESGLSQASRPSWANEASETSNPSKTTVTPKMGMRPGELRKEAARRFLAARSIGAAAGRSVPPGRVPQARAPAESLRLARAASRTLKLQTLRPQISGTPGSWVSIGPANVTTSAYGAVTGRITSLAADPNDATGNTLYVGATGGGVWKSTNAAGSAAGVTFSPLTDDLGAFSETDPSLSIGALTVQPSSSSVILAGTGDINDALDSYYGVGILRSADGGQTWTLIIGTKDAFAGGLENYSFSGEGFAGFAWSSVNPNLVVAAAAQSAEGVLVNAGSAVYSAAGLYYSSDAGQTWYMGIIKDGTDVIESPNVIGSVPGNSVTSVVWNRVRKRFYAAVRYHGYYESLDGVTWTRLVNQPGAGLSTTACPSNPGEAGQTSCPIFRGVLAVQPVTGDMFALTTDLNNLDQGLYEDVCSTSGLAVTACASSTVAFGTHIADGALENGTADPSLPATEIPLADYDLTLSAVASQQDTILFAGTEDIYRCSLANSCAWRNTTNIGTCAVAKVAPSQHATEATFGASGLLYFGNDGGLWRSTDTVGQTGSVCAASDASHYQNLNSGIGSLAEIEHFSMSPQSSTTILAGMGGFGTVATSTGAGGWQQLLTGEGSYTAIDPQNLSNWYTEAGSGVDIFRCTAGASCTAAGFGTAAIDSADVEGDANYFYDAAPWILDPLNSADVLLGTCRVWRGAATGGWSASNLLSPMLDGNQQPVCTDNAQLRSVNAGLNASAAAGSEQVYAGMAGPYDGGSTTPGHLFTSTVTTAGGVTTWTDRWHSPVTNSTDTTQFNEAGFAISSIAVDPHDATGQTVYVTIQGFPTGLEEGEVYESTDGGVSWLNITGNLPDAPANSIVVDPNDASILYVALDTGVYYTQNSADCANQALSCWAVYGSGLPTAPVTSLQIYSYGGSSTLEAATYGRGIWALGLLTSPAQVTLSPILYDFGSERVGVISPAKSFLLLNTGTTTMTITAIQTTGDFGNTDTCGATLAAGASCFIPVNFDPTEPGDRSGALTVYGNVAGGFVSSTLDGTGIGPGLLTATPTSLTFPETVLGVSSVARVFRSRTPAALTLPFRSLASRPTIRSSRTAVGRRWRQGRAARSRSSLLPARSTIGPDS